MRHLYNLLSADGAILNTVVADDAFVTEHHAGRFELLGPAPDDPVETLPRHVAVGSFFDRFGPAKWAILADPNPAVQALVKDCSVRGFIDLDRSDLPAALALLVQAGHAVNADEILGAPVQVGERP